jgi:hypothetical protein
MAEQAALADLTLDRARELFKKNDPAVYQDAIIARFHFEFERVAKNLATKVVGSEFIKDGFCPAVLAPIESVDSAIFMKAAKQAGAFEILAYKRLVT